MIDIKTQYAGLTLRNPLIVGSSGLTNNAERNKEFEKAGAGAIVLKSLFEEQIEMQSDILMQDSDYPEAADYIRGYVKANQINDYLELIQKTKELCTIPVIASINCYKSDAWIEFARQIELAGADALELNVFFLETNLTYNSENMRDLYVSIIRKVKETVSIPVMIKMSKMVGNIPAVAHTLTVNGADGIVLFNRFYQPDIDINNMQIVSGNVFSNHSDLSDTLRWTAIVSGKLPLLECTIGKMSSNACLQEPTPYRCVAPSIHMGQKLSHRCLPVLKNGCTKRIISRLTSSKAN